MIARPNTKNSAAAARRIQIIRSRVARSLPANTASASDASIPSVVPAVTAAGGAEPRGERHRRQLCLDAQIREEEHHRLGYERSPGGQPRELDRAIRDQCPDAEPDEPESENPLNDGRGHTGRRPHPDR